MTTTSPRTLRNRLLSLLTAALIGAAPVVARAEQGCPTASDTRRGTISGTISDPSGARIANARVSVECGDFKAETRTEQDGTFSLSVPPGAMRVRIEAPGFSASSQSVVVETDVQIPLTVGLSLAPVSNVVDVTDDSVYTATETASGTKTSTPLLQVPQAITVINRQLLDDQGVIKLDDALKNVAGVKAGGYYQDWDYYHIRGFDASFTTYIDGLRTANGIGEETFGLERVEILKGPSSSVYGQGTLGGIVNLQSKRPRRDTFGEIQFTGGSYGFVSPAVDLGFVLNEKGTVYARLNALYRHQDSFVDFVDKDRTFVAPSLTWDITSATTITILSRFQRDDNLGAFPLPAAGTVLPNINGEIPISRYTGEPYGNRINTRNTHLGYEFVHRFNDNFTLRNNTDVSWYKQKWDSVFYSAFLGEDQRTLFRYPYNYDNNWKTFTTDASLLANFDTGSVRHSLISGVEYYHYDDTYGYQSIDFGNLSSYVPIDLFNPTYGNPLPPLLPFVDGGDGRSNSTGLYVQDQIALTKRLRVTAGGRFETSTSKNEFDPDSQDDKAFTPRLGASYEFVPGAAVYGSFSRSFNPQFGRVFDGSTVGSFVDPERGEQFEGGIKTDLFNGRMNTTLAVYHLTRTNVATSDPLHPGFYVVTGEQRSRGAEAETFLRITPRWNLTAAYTYTDAEVTEDNSVPVGTRTQNVPKHSYNAWTTYQLPEEWIEGLGVGLGARYYTDQGGDLLDTFSLPAYAIADASIFYRRGRFRGQINVNNLFDRRHFLGSYDALYVQPGDPRMVRATVSWTF